MSKETNLNSLVINKLTNAQYQELINSNAVVNNELYFTIDDEFYSKEEVDNLLKNLPKIQLTTQLAYDALTTKDANTLYLIEEE